MGGERVGVIHNLPPLATGERAGMAECVLVLGELAQPCRTPGITTCPQALSRCRALALEAWHRLD